MAATWIWNGRYERLERVSVDPTLNRTIVESSGSSFGDYRQVVPGDAVVVMTHLKPFDPSRFRGVLLVNEGAAQAAAMKAAEKERRWQFAGLAREAREDERIYRVVLFHLEPLAITRIDRHGRPLSASMTRPLGRYYDEALVRSKRTSGNNIQWPEDAALRRVVKAATSGLYAIGLDIGEAEVALGADGRAAVRNARPLSAAICGSATIVNALRHFAQQVAADNAFKRSGGIKIGADPEFVLVRPDGRIASASRFLGEGTGGAAGSDALRIGRRIVYPVAELRPEPAEHPALLADHVRQLLFRALSRISDPTLRWAAGAMPVPGLALGGHIHISGVPLSARLLRLLDSYAALPLALVEDPAGRGRRPRYGVLGDFRLQPHGGFEYRTLPSWLVSPAAAKAAFALALLCARETLTLTHIPALEERYVEAFYAGDRTELVGCLDGVAAALAATPSYGELAPYIEPLFDAARRGTTWDERADFRLKWRIPLTR
ncbi:hypothetical protein [Paenibacillus sp. NEAU-GSW1]|uniref:putative amidoligase domain-containing protein n=1 Tax=Paenibacillus sp. NEAU-GSW1 TaxID=2682486 RepID=UPI0012E32550|nr:hypothetical protein [Paenibacillus sp. NEAU-GSW1]MUT65358.1 hypothetical protein [Paenibacillus sp. NEAU-GSW1]